MAERRQGERRTHSGWQKASLFASRNWLGALVLVLAILSAVASIRYSAQANENSYETRESQFRACVLNGNALRDDVRGEFIDLKRSAIIRVYKDFIDQAPPREQLPPDAVESLNILTSTVSRLQRRIHTIDERIPNVDCLAVYPPLDGQRYPLDLVQQARAQIATKP